MTRNLLWLSLPDQRPRREVYWMSRMPATRVTAVAAERPVGDLAWIEGSYRRPIKRFVEAGAFGWLRHLDRLPVDDCDWVASLELCALVTGQASRLRRRNRHLRQAVITWENLARQPLYRVPPYHQALESCRDADLLLCMVDAAKAHLLANGFDEARIRVVKPGVDTDVFRPAQNPSTDRPRVAFVSPLAHNKGIDQVLTAFALVRAEFSDAELVVAGRGDLRPLVEQAAADPDSGVRLVGNLDAHGVADLLRSAHVFVTAPRPTWKWEEQFGLAYVEAAGCGLPVVTTRCGSNSEALCDPDASFTADEPEAIAEALLQRLRDPSRARDEGLRNASWVAEHHDVARQCERMADAFTSVEDR